MNDGNVRNDRNISIWIFRIISVLGDVSDLGSSGVSSTTLKSSGSDDSNGFSILTKEFLNRPDGEDGRASATDDQGTVSIPNSGRNLAPFPVLRINGLESNTIGESGDRQQKQQNDVDDEPQGYFYDKPMVPFEDGEPSNIEPVTSTTEEPPSKIEEFDGYFYPKPAVPFPFPETTTESDAETLPDASARSINAG